MSKGHLVARRTCLFLALTLWPGLATSARAQLTADEAVAAVYPGAEIKAEQLVLTPAQRKQALERSDADVPTASIARFIAARNGMIVGRAYVDTHTVGTARETLLVALNDDGAVLRVDLIAFLGPADSHPPAAWLAHYRGQTLSDDLTVNRGIRPLAGATLTARAVNDAVRRTLAIDALLQQGVRR